MHGHQADPEPCGEIVDPRFTGLDDVVEDLLATLLDGGIGRPGPGHRTHRLTTVSPLTALFLPDNRPRVNI